jgi:hypothetical protein
VPSWGSFSFAYGPLLAMALLLGLVVIMRWAFTGGASLVRPARGRDGRPDEYGMLVEVAAPGTLELARVLAAALEAQGIDATVAGTTAGPRVMVWPDDVGRARVVVRGIPGG